MITKADTGFSKIEKLSKTHELNQFSCGHDSLDEWLKKYALSNQVGESAKTYVTTRSNAVVGYYALMAGSIHVERSSTRAAKGQPRNGAVPIALLARLAVDQTCQGQGLGTALLKDALIRCANAADVIGVRAVLVHALDEEARRFYQRFDFEESPADGMTLMLMMKDIRAELAD